MKTNISKYENKLKKIEQKVSLAYCSILCNILFLFSLLTSTEEFKRCILSLSLSVEVGFYLYISFFGIFCLLDYFLFIWIYKMILYSKDHIAHQVLIQEYLANLRNIYTKVDYTGNTFLFDIELPDERMPLFKKEIRQRLDMVFKEYEKGIFYPYYSIKETSVDVTLASHTTVTMTL